MLKRWVERNTSPIRKLPVSVSSVMRKCSVSECARRHYAKSLCKMHYARWIRTGEEGSPYSRGRFETPEESFAARTERRGECLIWTSALTEAGYGRIAVDGGWTSAHRYAWEREHGSIPDQMKVDHRYHCDPACVEVTHLRLATNAQNGQNRSGATVRSKTGVRNVKQTEYGYQVFVGTQSFGTYKTITEASAVAEQKRREMFGEYAGKG